MQKMLLGMMCWFSLLSTPYLHAHQSIVICQIVEHTALNQMIEGMREKLSNRKDLDISIENAQGNPTTAAQIAQKVAGQGYDLTIGLGTPMAQALSSSSQSQPLLFGAVTDPVGSKLVKALDEPGKNVSGVTDQVPLGDVVALIQALVPNATSIGVIYNSGESNAVSQVKEIKALAKQKGLRIVEATVLKSSDILMATKNLVSTADVILVPTDNTVISALESLTKTSIAHKVPVVGIDVDTVRRGALAALGVDWVALGKQLGDMSVSVLDGSQPSQIAVESPADLYLHINLETAEKIGLNVSDDLINKADKLYSK